MLVILAKRLLRFSSFFLLSMGTFGPVKGPFKANCDLLKLNTDTTAEVVRNVILLDGCTSKIIQCADYF